jgi:1-aminocyclopropane-1-carboxylate deaminase/D-cysteine desulfhydrase-like pyridoxal-dependent ACC family enzyme
MSDPFFDDYVKLQKAHAEASKEARRQYGIWLDAVGRRDRLAILADEARMRVLEKSGEPTP